MATTQQKVLATFQDWVLFLKSPETFRAHSVSGDIILFVSSQRGRLEAGNLAVILVFVPLATSGGTTSSGWAGWSFTNGFSGPTGLRDFRETDPWSSGLANP